ncbi:MAG: hypothetical protein JW841_08525 [Deltaproteobacteria bacterium]|nr:hypothetical protein [Deltaproteobacteria bacterium]
MAPTITFENGGSQQALNNSFFPTNASGPKASADKIDKLHQLTASLQDIDTNVTEKEKQQAIAWRKMYMANNPYADPSNVLKHFKNYVKAIDKVDNEYRGLYGQLLISAHGDNKIAKNMLDKINSVSKQYKDINRSDIEKLGIKLLSIANKNTIDDNKIKDAHEIFNTLLPQYNKLCQFQDSYNIEKISFADFIDWVTKLFAAALCHVSATNDLIIQTISTYIKCPDITFKLLADLTTEIVRLESIYANKSGQYSYGNATNNLIFKLGDIYNQHSEHLNFNDIKEFLISSCRANQAKEVIGLFNDWGKAHLYNSDNAQ